MIVKVTEQKDYTFVVDVFDEKDELICYCGPYNREQALTCSDLFIKAGWKINTFPKGFH